MSNKILANNTLCYAKGKKVLNVYKNNMPIWTYSWEPGEWSVCSKSCGDGIQTRELKCKRSNADGSFIYVDNEYCELLNLTKPDVQKVCNNQTCLDAVDDTFSVTQDSSLTIQVSDILKNDSGLYPPFILSSIFNIVGGSAALAANSITFTPNVKAGNNAGFSYILTDSLNNSTAGHVTINVTQLPEISAYVYSTADATTFMNSYTPPTLSTIFSSWARYSNSSAYYPPGTTPAGEAASWEMISENQFRCTANTGWWTGFISPSKLDNYTHEVTLSSTDTDDDCIGLVIAFYRDTVNSINHSLILVRDCNGTSLCGGMGFAIIYTKNPSTSFSADGTSTVILKTPTLTTWKATTQNWSVMSPTRVKVERAGNIIRVWTSTFNSTTINESSKMEIDLNDYAILSWALEKRPYGYCCMSQKYSSFTNVVLSGDLNRNQVIDFETNKIWNWNSTTGKWEASTTQTIQSIYGWPRVLVNEITGIKYQINETTVTIIS